MPTVSIITPSYNSARFVEHTLRSVQAQTFTDWEMIITNDGSKDHSPEIIARYAETDPRIRLISQPNGGSAAARNNSLRNASGRYVCFLDSDDTWDPDFLASQLAFIKEHDAPLVYSSFRRMDVEGREILRPYLVPAKVSYRRLLRNNVIGCLTVMTDREKTGDVFFDESMGSLRDDFALWLSILKKHPYAYGNPRVLASYRVMTASATGNKKKLIKPQYNLYRRIEGLGVIPSLFYMCTWAVTGFLKYRK